MLLFDEAFATACERYASTLVHEREVLACLGPAAMPHLSLLHVDTERSPEQIWADATSALEPTYTIESHSLSLLPYQGELGRMAYLIVPCTPALRRAEERALQLPSLRDAPVATRNGERFQPHLTLAIWAGPAPVATTELAADVVPREGIQGRLALVEIGNHGTCRRILHE